MGRRAWVIVSVATGALWFAGAPADAWHARTSVAPSCSGLHVRLVVTFENDEQAPNRAMTVTAKDLQTGKSTGLGVVSPGKDATANLDSGIGVLGAGTVQFLVTWTDGPPGTDRISLKYSGLDCRVPTPVLADGLNGVSLLGLGAVAVPGVVIWRRRRLHRAAA